MSSELTADTLKADAKAGASDPSVLQVGLLFQEALDGKLYAALDRSKICSALGVSARQVPPPHWHKKAWEQLGDVKLDDADRLQQLIDKKHNFVRLPLKHNWMLPCSERILILPDRNPSGNLASQEAILRHWSSTDVP
jgi:hypothetical protein